MGKEQIIDWRNNLTQSRGVLFDIRDRLVISWIKINSSEDRDEKIALGKDWADAVYEEVFLTEDVISPAKIELGLKIKDKNQEKRVKRRARRISLENKGTPEQGLEIARHHIKLTKKIQKRMGVLE